MSSFRGRWPVGSSVVAFFVMATVLGAGTVTLVVLGIVPAEATVASALSASAAGIVMTAIEDGRAGLKRMLRRLLIWRVGIGYWLFASLFIVVAIIAGSMLNPLLGGDPVLPEILTPSPELLVMFAGLMIAAGLGQELGWTGFLMPRLQARRSALASCVIRAVLVALWHLPLLFYAGCQPAAFSSIPYGEWVAQKGFALALGVLLVFALCWSILIGWLFNNTEGSLLLVAVFHGSEIWVAYWMGNAGIDPSSLDNYWGYGAVMAAMAITLVIATGAQDLSRKRPRIASEERAT